MILIPAVWLSITLAGIADSSPSANIAVITTPDTADLGALVITELSSHSQVHLLERDDLAKIGDKAKVQQMAGSDSIVLGKLVGADGLFFLDKENGVTRVRFTAVSLGYALFDDQLEGSENPAQQAKALAHRVTDYAPKLRLDPTKSVPLSVVNLRADTSDPQTVGLERPLTLLVESRLSLVPEYVVLERRHAWSLGFEHSLDTSAKPLLRGAFLIDGTISRNGNSDACIVHLRLRDPHGGADKTADITGTTSDPAALANKILSEIETDIPHASAALTNFDTAREADEYLHEALWGWRSKAPESALEAVDSAELLGASPYSVVPIRVNILCALADQGMEMYDPKDTNEPPPVLTTPSLEARVDTIERAINEVARYRDEKMEDHLQGIVPDNSPERFFFRTGEILPKVCWIASKLLLMLENEQSPRADELRLRIRKASGYDPLHGKNGVMICNSGFDNGNSADPFADDWAQTLEEELAWYHLEFVDTEAYTPRWFYSDPDARFCSRFLTTPEARSQAWHDFIDSLKNNPKSQRLATVLKTHDKDPAVADQAYRDYLAYLDQRHDQIGASNDYDPLFGDYSRMDEQVQARNTQAALPLLHALLNTPQPGQWSIYLIKMLWRPSEFSAADAPELWKEINGYEKRRNDVTMQKDGRQDTSFISQMDELTRPFVQKFPEVAAAPLPDIQPAPDANLPKLTVSQFWYPWVVPDVPADNNPIFSTYANGKDEVFVAAYLNRLERGVIFKVHLPDLATKEIQSMDGGIVQGLLWTPDALYAPLGSERKNIRHQLARYDFSTGTWTKHELSAGYIDNEMYFVNGAIYLGSAVGLSIADEDSGLSKYDWDKDQVTVLASSRRRPAQNQFDDASPYRLGGVFAGPGGKPAMSTYLGDFYIQETPGPWPTLINAAYNDQVADGADGTQTLVYNDNGEATLIDPKTANPIPLMASDQPTYRPVDNGKSRIGPVPTPWTAQTVFDCPPGKRKDMSGNTAFHDGHIYIFSQPDRTRNEYELLYYDKARGRAPLHIPIEFHFTDPERVEMGKHPGHPPNGWAIDDLEHPRRPFEPHLLGTNQGLCLKLMEAGFWFIPYRDIEAYAKSAPPHPKP